MHKTEVEDHLRWIHAQYKQGKDTVAQSSIIKPKPSVVNVKFKTEKVENFKTFGDNKVNPDMISHKSEVLSESASSGINSLNKAISLNADIEEQRHDMFDPNGTVDWGAGEMGGFLTSNMKVNNHNVTQNEL